MSPVEIYTKWRVQPQQWEIFLSTARDIVARTGSNNPGTLRCDWFVNEACHEAIAMAVHGNATALIEHLANCGKLYDQLTARAKLNLQWVGKPPAAALAALPVAARMAIFDSGLQSESAANRFQRATGTTPLPHIEIFTRFAVHAGALPEFRRYASECLERVRQADPGTSRYDWFYDETNRVCLALDTYNDPASMFAHMKNCHSPHARLLELSSMTTEFLGELPPEAFAAIEKYKPYVARFVVGLKPYSSGGFC